MPYKSLEECLLDLEKNGHLVRVKEEVDGNLEMAAIHLRVQETGGPALLFEKIKNCKFRAASNIFGTKERAQFIFRDTIETVKKIVELKSDPVRAIKHPFANAGTALKSLKAFPKKIKFSAPVLENEISISDLPQIKHWKNDGGAFVTMPIVYTEDVDQPGIMHSNLGMYRVQLSGNDYVRDKEIGMHYQLHRGIGIHQTKANKKNIPLKVSVFVGGPPSLSFAAVMPLPEGISELTFAGILGNRKVRYTNKDGFFIATECDFAITGEIFPGENKPEGPFGDHFGYYSLKHNFPVMRVHKVWHKKNAIWPFTVVGRPPQEETSFGWLVHELAGAGLKDEIPGLKEVNAVDAAGVHPLLLAIGSERYTPYLKEKRPSELLTIANHILGSGQLSLAKYLFITAAEDQPALRVNNVAEFFMYMLERINFERDIHFYTNTSIDTLDYSGDGLNAGSKVVFAAAGEKLRELKKEIPGLNLPPGFENVKLVLPGIISISAPKFISSEKTQKEIEKLSEALQADENKLNGLPLIILCDDSSFVSHSLNNFLWATFTKSNPANDIYGIDSFITNKHWGCKGSLIIDARTKTHHAPALEKDPETEKRIDRIFAKGGSLSGL